MRRVPIGWEERVTTLLEYSRVAFRPSISPSPLRHSQHNILTNLADAAPHGPRTRAEPVSRFHANTWIWWIKTGVYASIRWTWARTAPSDFPGDEARHQAHHESELVGVPPGSRLLIPYTAGAAAYVNPVDMHGRGRGLLGAMSIRAHSAGAGRALHISYLEDRPSIFTDILKPSTWTTGTPSSSTSSSGIDGSACALWTSRGGTVRDESVERSARRIWSGLAHRAFISLLRRARVGTCYLSTSCCRCALGQRRRHQPSSTGLQDVVRRPPLVSRPGCPAGPHIAQRAPLRRPFRQTPCPSQRRRRSVSFPAAPRLGALCRGQSPPWPSRQGMGVQSLRCGTPRSVRADGAELARPEEHGSAWGILRPHHPVPGGRHRTLERKGRGERSGRCWAGVRDRHSPRGTIHFTRPSWSCARVERQGRRSSPVVALRQQRCSRARCAVDADVYCSHARGTGRLRRSGASPPDFSSLRMSADCISSAPALGSTYSHLDVDA
ncbi:hypothetical protein C8R46DRAFT_600362 [Mycena filopes]|nr:hypothetical protein C8R46DRAFT_600362 [Mycena filopes]